MSFRRSSPLDMSRSVLVEMLAFINAPVIRIYRTSPMRERLRLIYRPADAFDLVLRLRRQRSAKGSLTADAASGVSGDAMQ